MQRTQPQNFPQTNPPQKPTQHTLHIEPSAQRYSPFQPHTITAVVQLPLLTTSPLLNKTIIKTSVAERAGLFWQLSGR